MKKKLVVLIAFAVPVCFYLNVWQAYRYRMVENDVIALEKEQQEWLEANKKVIVGIEVLGAPERIDTVASEIDGLENPGNPSVIRVELGNGGGDG